MDVPNFVLKFCIILMILPVTVVCCYFGYVDKNYQIVIFGFVLLLFSILGNYLIFIKGNKSSNSEQ
ncbi:hypothetical protein [Bacillus sp. AFS055030]|uniref:hypothetical protein n=1 Tax=Bacillus sp. AFS055030 TaxID=2033507 RepID=UPI000BFBF8E8|nr:hypothetical protein [Bacillus sp. AFS055030]PGL67800.1 hypothetical protein CN925_19080 [Bacillus sp. AFS055030]